MSTFRENLERYFKFASSFNHNDLTIYTNVEMTSNMGDIRAGDKFDQVILDRKQKLEKGWQRVRFAKYLDQDLKFLGVEDSNKKMKKEECPSN